MWVELKIAAITRSFHVLGFKWKEFEAMSGTQIWVGPGSEWYFRIYQTNWPFLEMDVLQVVDKHIVDDSFLSIHEL